MNLGFKSADILLPNVAAKDIDLTKWSVVACDQYTSEPEYWAQVEEIVGQAPSTLRLILPEVYLGADDEADRLAGIHASMEQYLKQELLTSYPDAMIYVERTDSSGQVRAGLVGAIDLEAYDYHKGSTSLVRATEATVLERIPPRVKVRQKAPIELPHIMILIDDREKSVIEPLANADLPLVYDFDLMQGGGHLKGYLVDQAHQEEILSALSQMADQSHFDQLYETKDMPVLLYAMGDGNHSLATAKAFYEQLKASDPDADFSNHPARYALAELVNLHSPALQFEAIHRIITEVDADAIMQEMTETLGLIPAADQDGQVMTVVIKGQKKDYKITKPCSKLTVGSLQIFLDAYVKANGCGIDYIHGIDVLEKLTMEEKTIGFILPDMGKEELFPTVIADGALPRKTFSMGHAQDKRFYMECRKIR